MHRERDVRIIERIRTQELREESGSCAPVNKFVLSRVGVHIIIGEGGFYDG